MNVEYIKDYKYKELKQYVLAYLLIRDHPKICVNLRCGVE